LSDSDDDNDANEPEQYPSLDSVPSDASLSETQTFSPKTSEPPSLSESMMMMDEILADKTMDRLSRIDKLEAILSAATQIPSEQVRNRKLECGNLGSLMSVCFFNFRSMLTA
jgi:exonuclease 3'-5' domain-containing protein 1